MDTDIADDWTGPFSYDFDESGMCEVAMLNRSYHSQGEWVKLEDYRTLERQLAEASASRDTYREQYEFEQKQDYQLRCHLIEIAKVLDKHDDSTLPHHTIQRVRELREDMEDFANKWDELTTVLGAHGENSDPLVGSDTTEDIHKRAIDRVRVLTEKLKPAP